MPIDPAQIELIAFDYGNTLIPFGPDESSALADSFHADLEALFGPVDIAHARRLGTEARLAPFAGDSPSLREHDFETLLAEIVAALYGAAPDTDRLADLRRRRHEQFVGITTVEEHVHETLAHLGTRYRLALLSNYPDGPAIRGSLDRLGLTRYFEHIVVSGEVGYVKPHPITFAQLLAPFRIPARRACYVGDNWLCDIQGAKRIGMQAIQISRWLSIDHHEVGEGDHAPDHVIAHLSELTTIV